MTIPEFYDSVGGSYQDIISRLHTDERIIKFLKLFLKDDSYQILKKYMQEENWEKAFLAAHNLKGVTRNLSMDDIGNAASNVTEALRKKDTALAKKLLPDVDRAYNNTRSLLYKLLK